MSEMDKGVVDGERLASPIVLVIGNNSSSYLDDNELLQVLYGENAPRRVVMRDTSEGHVAWELFNTQIYGDNVDSRLTKLKLLERYDHVPEKDLERFLEGGSFIASVFKYILEFTGMSEEDSKNVGAVICDSFLLVPDMPMYRVMGHFPGAPLFSVDEDRGIPRRLKLSGNTKDSPS